MDDESDDMLQLMSSLSGAVPVDEMWTLEITSWQLFT